MQKLTQRSKEMEMTASLTLNKITAQKGISIGEAASRVADLGWTPSYVQEAMTFPTDYKISKTPRDPMKQVLRSYFPMQEEKDNRVYGALAAAWDRIVKKNYVHKTAQFFAVGWSANFWRIEAQTEKDFEWFEHKYPGWYAEFGDFWKWHAKLSVPGETNILFNSDVGYAYPHRCWSCMVPCLIREDFVCDEVDGKMYTYCSEGCRWTHKVA